MNAPTARVHIRSGASQDPFKVQVAGNVKMLVDDLGGTTIGSDAAPPANGLLVSGSSGFGSAPGSYKVKITHGTFGFNIENTTTKDDWELWANSGGLSLYANGSFRGNFDPTSGAYTPVSDQRAKSNIQPMPSILDRIARLEPSTYQLGPSDGADRRIMYGFIAQDVAAVFPHLVSHHADDGRGLDSYTLDYSGFGVLAIKAIQELQQKVDALEARIAELEAARETSRPLSSSNLSGRAVE